MTDQERMTETARTAEEGMSLHEAVAACDELMQVRRRAFGQMLLYLFFLLAIVFMLVLMSVLFLECGSHGSVSSVISFLETSRAGWFAFVAVLSLVFIIVSLYRMHAREYTRLEVAKMGLLRSGVAAAVAGREDRTEVVKALVKDAFSSEAEQRGRLGKKSLESPLPGQPTSDLLTMIVNKLFQMLDDRQGTGKAEKPT